MCFMGHRRFRCSRALRVSVPGHDRIFSREVEVLNCPRRRSASVLGSILCRFSGTTDPANRQLACPGSFVRRFRHVIDPTGLAGGLRGHFDTAALATSAS